MENIRRSVENDQRSDAAGWCLFRGRLWCADQRAWTLFPSLLQIAFDWRSTENADWHRKRQTQNMLRRWMWSAASQSDGLLPSALQTLEALGGSREAAWVSSPSPTERRRLCSDFPAGTSQCTGRRVCSGAPKSHGRQTWSAAHSVRDCSPQEWVPFRQQTTELAVIDEAATSDWSQSCGLPEVRPSVRDVMRDCRETSKGLQSEHETGYQSIAQPTAA